MLCLASREEQASVDDAKSSPSGPGGWFWSGRETSRTAGSPWQDGVRRRALSAPWCASARAAVAAAAAVAVVGVAQVAHSADLLPAPAPTIEPAAFDERWSAAFGAYVWAASLDGSVGVGRLPTADVSASFGDILENLDLAFMAAGEVRYDRFGVFADFVYTRVSADGSGPLGFVTAEATAEVTTATLMGQFRAVERDRSSIDVMAGARLWNVGGDLSLTGPLGNTISRTRDETWVDPMIGARARLQGGSPWYATGWGMIGGFGVSSDIAWDVLAGVGYEFNDRISLLAGYRALGVDYRDDDFVFDVVQHGPVISGILRF